MPAFAYKARMLSGSTTEGTIDAADQRAAMDELRKQKLIPIEVNESSRALGEILAGINPFKPKVKSKELVLFSRQLSTLVSAGVPFVSRFVIFFTWTCASKWSSSFFACTSCKNASTLFATTSPIPSTFSKSSAVAWRNASMEPNVFAKTFGSIEAFRHATAEDLEKVEGIGDVVAKSVLAFLHDVHAKKELDHLLAHVHVKKMTKRETNGTPAETRVESWRENNTSSLDFTFGLNGLMPARISPRARELSLTSIGMSFCLRNSSIAARWSAASMVPSVVLPESILAL
jgi:hypothetical protein